MPKGVYKRKPFTKEHKEKLKKNAIKRGFGILIQPKIVWMKGRKMDDYPQIGFQKGHPSYHTKKSREKLRKFAIKTGFGKARLGKKLSKKHIEQIRQSRLGKKRSDEVKEKIRQGRLRRKKRLGYLNSLETRKKMKESQKGLHIGSKNNFWEGGISFEIYSKDWTKTLKEAIRQRDNFICQECETHQDKLDKKLAIHHIDYNKKNCDPKNLISLCNKCHCKTNFNRKYWIQHFYKKLGGGIENGKS